MRLSLPQHIFNTNYLLQGLKKNQLHQTKLGTNLRKAEMLAIKSVLMTSLEYSWEFFISCNQLKRQGQLLAQ